MRQVGACEWGCHCESCVHRAGTALWLPMSTPMPADAWGDAPLHYITRWSAPASIVVALVLAGAQLDAANSSGATPLQLGSERFKVAVRQALAAQETLMRAQQMEQRGMLATPLHRAVAFNQPGVLRSLLQTSSPDVAERLTGDTPLTLAAEFGHERCLLELLAASAQLDAADRAGFTATHGAASRGHWHCLRALLAADADHSLQTCHGCQPLHLAALDGEMFSDS